MDTQTLLKHRTQTPPDHGRAHLRVMDLRTNMLYKHPFTLYEWGKDLEGGCFLDFWT